MLFNLTFVGVYLEPVNLAGNFFSHSEKPYGWLRLLSNHLINGSHCSQSGQARYGGSS